jgi:hypothetical protein
MKRYKAAIPFILECEEQDAPALQHTGVTNDVSLRGLGFSLDKPEGLQVGMPLAMNLFHVIGEQPIKARGEVCWLALGDKEGKPTKLGIKLTAIPSRRHYERWLELLAVASQNYTEPNMQVAHS